MNIDTSSLTSGSEAAAYMASSQARKIHGGNTFSSHLQTLQMDSNTESETVENKVSTKDSDVKAQDSSKKEKKSTESNVELKVDNKNATQDVEAQNEQAQQNGQNSSEQHGQNQQSAELSDEILSVMKANAKTINGVNNFKLVTGISEDINLSSAKIDYSRFAMSDDDAMFFANLVSKTDMTMQSISGEFQKALTTGNIEQVQKTAKVSSVLLEALSESMKTNKAFRIDFDNDVSVILRVDRDGNLNANFIPGDKAVEAYLRNNIPFLKQRFEEQNLSYGELTYSKHKRQDQDDEKQNNKENGHE